MPNASNSIIILLVNDFRVQSDVISAVLFLANNEKVQYKDN